MLVLLSPLFCLSQDSKIDSLKNVLNNTDGEGRFPILEQLTIELGYNQPEITLNYAEEMLTLATASNNDDWLKTAYNAQATAYRYLEKYEKAIISYGNALEYQSDSVNASKTTRLLRSLSKCYLNIGEVDSALSFRHKSLEIQKTQNNKQGEASDLSEIGYIYKRMG